MPPILALIDFSSTTNEVLQTAGSVARLTKGRLVLLHVAMPFTVGLAGEPGNHQRRNVLAEAFRCRRREIKKLARDLNEQGVDTRAMIVRGRSLCSNPVQGIVQVVNRLSPEMIVTSPHRRSRFNKIFSGKVTGPLQRQVRCPILLVPEGK